jgi:hypothetical protein
MVPVFCAISYWSYGCSWTTGMVSTYCESVLWTPTTIMVKYVVEQKQPDDKYDIAQNIATIQVTQEQPYRIIRHWWTSKVLFVMHSVINHLFTRTTNENEMDLSSREKCCSKMLFTLPECITIWQFNVNLFVITDCAWTLLQEVWITFLNNTFHATTNPFRFH